MPLLSPMKPFGWRPRNVIYTYDQMRFTLHSRNQIKSNQLKSNQMLVLEERGKPEWERGKSRNGWENIRYRKVGRNFTSSRFEFFLVSTICCWVSEDGTRVKTQTFIRAVCIFTQPWVSEHGHWRSIEMRVFNVILVVHSCRVLIARKCTCDVEMLG